MMGFDSTRPNAARMYDYALGGKDNFKADREAAERIKAKSPTAYQNAFDNRGFLKRAVRWAVASGVNQFLDIGSGLPTAENTHEIVRGGKNISRVVYVDNDPVVINHAKVLLKGEPQVFFLSGDLREPMGFLDDPALRAFINLRQPVAIVLVAVLHFLRHPEAYEVVNAIKQAVAPGSCLIISHAAGDSADADTIKTVKDVYDQTSSPIVLRTHYEVTMFFDGFDLAGPVSNINDWWNPSEENSGETRSAIACYGGVAIKPGN